MQKQLSVASIQNNALIKTLLSFNQSSLVPSAPSSSPASPPQRRPRNGRPHSLRTFLRTYRPHRGLPTRNPPPTPQPGGRAGADVIRGAAVVSGLGEAVRRGRRGAGSWAGARGGDRRGSEAIGQWNREAVAARAQPHGAGARDSNRHGGFDQGGDARFVASFSLILTDVCGPGRVHSCARMNGSVNGLLRRRA